MKINFPQWFIDDLYSQEDKDLATNGELPITKEVSFVCKEGHVYVQKVLNHIDTKTLQPKYGCKVCKYNLMSSCRSETSRNKRHYPQWFIDELVNENDKERAISGELKTTEKVDFLCAYCHQIYSQKISHHINLKTQEPFQKCPNCRYKKIPITRYVPDKRVIKVKEETIVKGSIKDSLEGKQFGDLTILHQVEDHISDSGRKYKQYLCKCSCGNEIIVYKNNLVSGKTIRCKDCKIKKLVEASRQRGDQSDPPRGSVFGNLTILEKFYHTDSKGRNTQFYRCQCSCGNITEIAKNSVLKGFSTSCGCNGSRNKLREKRIALGELTDPEIGTRFGKLTVLQIIPPPEGGSKQIECKCECGNIVIINKPSLLGGNYRTCGHCPNQYPQWFIDRLVDSMDKQKAINGTLQTPEIVKVSCPRCGEIVERKVNSLINLSTQEAKREGFCKKCSYHTSKEETEIYNFLLSLGLDKNQIQQNTRSLLKDGRSTKELDFYLPDYKLAIEYNGSYFHFEVRKPKDYHLEKFRYCEELGIRLISIFEMDWNNAKEKLQNLIRYSILPKQRVYARQCTLKEVSIEEAFNFYDTYHIQNKSPLSKINLGLFYNKELLAVMGFGSSSFHNRQKNEGDYELHRFAVKTGYTIIGGASKLLKYFEKEYNPRFLLSYSWNDWFSGDMYSKLGFTLDRMVPPDYYWYLNGECINKRQCRLKTLLDKYPDLYQRSIDEQASNKEDYIMESLGALKVYRSGSKRWIKRYN